MTIMTIINSNMTLGSMSFGCWVMVMVFQDNLNNILAISWRSVLYVILLLTIVILVLTSHIAADDIQVAVEDSHITADYSHTASEDVILILLKYI
jgi:hypothetical protein